LAIMAKSVSWEAVPLEAVAWLKAQQNDDGGWGPSPEGGSNTENTALSIQALIAAGELPGSQPVQKAILYLQERQTEDSGFASSALVSASDPASTSQAIQALLAAGENLFSNEWRRCLNTPFDALLDAQAGDGSFGSDVDITAAAVPGLMGRSMPLPGRYLAALKALEWLKTQQDTDGGFGNGGVTADAVYAIARCGQDPDGTEWAWNGHTPLQALEVQTPDYIESAPGDHPAGELAKVIRAVHAAGGDPTDFPPPRDLVVELQHTYHPGTGRYHPSKTYSHDLAILALTEVGETVPPEAVTEIETDQNDDGGWSWAWDGASDVDSTGLTMQALTAGGGPSSPDITDHAADFLEDLRFPGGGYPDLATRPEPNCDSTSLAIQGQLATGGYRQEPLLFALETGAVTSSWDALLAFQEPAGSFVASASVPESRLLATLEAIHALTSPLYPAYQPLEEGDATMAGTVHARLTCGHGLGVVAPYSGDDNNDGSASLRYRVVGDAPSEWEDMGKGGLSYLELLDLQAGTGYEIEVAYNDPDGISGDGTQLTQLLNIYMGRACIPTALRSYAG
ncbi:MAG: prenyltransferase/squalene oxidase repeat-containing protein, partial [Anaerolineae bacterium]